MSHEYEDLRRVTYGESDSEHGRAVFVPVCPKCSRFVKPHDKMSFDYDGQPRTPNATCKKCGEVVMPFEGYL